MQTVYKYPLPHQRDVTIELPRGAEILSVGAQDDNAVLWARADPHQPKVIRKLRIIGTGHPDADGTFIGTILLHDGRLVFHVFEVP